MTSTFAHRACAPTPQIGAPRLLWAFVLAGAACLAAGAVGPAYAYDTIVNQEERPKPWVINGCEIKPKTSCPGADLRHADLKEADLSGADLKGAKLSRADLRHANLRGADFTGAKLDGAKLQIAFIQGGNFKNA